MGSPTDGVAVHFDINWQPNGWTSRQGALMLALGTSAFLLVIFAVACYAMRSAAVSSFGRWAMVAVFYVVLGFVYWVNTWIVERNLTPRSKPFAELDTKAAFLQGLKPAILVDQAARLKAAPFQHGVTEAL